MGATLWRIPNLLWSGLLPDANGLSGYFPNEIFWVELTHLAQSSGHFFLFCTLPLVFSLAQGAERAHNSWEVCPLQCIGQSSSKRAEYSSTKNTPHYSSYSTCSAFKRISSCQPTQLPLLQLKLLNEKGEVQCETRARMGSFYHVAATFPFTEHLRLSTARSAKGLFEMLPIMEVQSKPRY